MKRFHAFFAVVFLLVLTFASALNAQSVYPFSPETGTRVQVSWERAEDSTVLEQRVSTYIYDSIRRLVKAQLPWSAVKSISTENGEVTIVLRSSPYVVVDPKPAPPKPTVNDFVPEYRALYPRLLNGDDVFVQWQALTTRIRAAGFSVGQVAAAAGATAGK